MPDSTQDTLEHISKVQARITELCDLLTVRAARHDASKLVEPEKSGFDVLTAKLAELKYGTDEYRAALKEGKSTIDHHYYVNDHHPEHWPNGIRDMSLLSIVEMCCDWVAAGERVKDGDPMRSLEINRQRFGISDQLYSIIVNTFREMGWVKDVSM